MNPLPKLRYGDVLFVWEGPGLITGEGDCSRHRNSLPKKVIGNSLCVPW